MMGGKTGRSDAISNCECWAYGENKCDLLPMQQMKMQW